MTKKHTGIKGVLHRLFGEQEIEDTFAIKFTNRALFALIFPLVIDQFLGILMGIMDTVMVSSLGDATVSGVSLMDMIFNLIFSVFSALATGGAVIASQCIGAGKPDKACKSAMSLMIICLVSSLSVYLVVALWDTAMIKLFFGSIEADVMTAATTYLRTVAVSFPATALYSAGSALFRSMGDSKITMYANTAANIMNIGGNALCIYVLKWGVFGAALSTVVSRYALAVFYLILLANKDKEIHIDYRASLKEKPDGKLMKEILGVGLPSSLENGTFQLGRILVVSIISTFGTAQIAANAVANNIDSFGVMPGFAFNLAIITVVGQCVGAGDNRAVKYYTAKLIRLCYASFIVFDAVLLSNLSPLLSLYSISDEARSLAVILILIHDVGAVFIWTPSFVLPNAMKAAGEARYVMVVAVLSMFICRVALSKYLGDAYGMGAIGVWCAMIVDWIVRITCFALRWRKMCRTTLKSE